MQQYTDSFELITEKIRDTKIALFKPEINSELFLPNNVVQILRVDESGSLWFFTSCNGRQAANINKSFYAYLDFHKPGMENRLCVNGPAQIVDEPEDIQALIAQSQYSPSIAPSLVLVKMKIMLAEYFETGSHIQGLSWKDRFVHSLQNWFTDSPSKTYDFS